MSDFWSKRLGTSPAPSVSYPTPPMQSPQFRLPASQPHAGASVAPRQASSARQTATCPECGSSNYGKVGSNTGVDVMRCYECGYPVKNSASGLGSVGANGAGHTYKAEQVSSHNDGFNPQNVSAGRIG